MTFAQRHPDRRALLLSTGFLGVLCILGCRVSVSQDEKAREAAQQEEVRKEEKEGQAANTVVYLPQGWSEEVREQFYFLTQGSQLLPYDWFLYLEQADSQELFRSDSHMEKLRFIPQSPSPRNLDGLPIGFVVDDNPATVDDGTLYRIKQAYLGPEHQPKDMPRTNRWVGLTCAACHTADLHHGDQVFRIDGGSAMADVEQFLIRLAAAVDATWRDEAKLSRFAEHVLTDAGRSGEKNRDLDDREAEKSALKSQLEAHSRVLEQLVRRSRGTTPYGFARLDAFGAILNEICETALGLPNNHHPADAPASYPFLWDTPRLDWVQWNGSAGSPMARNVGEVLGVFGQMRLDPIPPQDQFRSTVRVDFLDRLEQYVAQLEAPAWPEALGQLDPELVERGRELYTENCRACHQVRGASTGRFEERTIGRDSFIKTTMVPVDRIGTDPQLADNFVKRLARPGALAKNLPPPFTGRERVPRPVLLAIAVEGVIRRNVQVLGLDEEDVAAFRAHRPANERPPDVWAYKARPLNGIWATAPFLHNGSVPTLYDLLLPEYQRPTTFHVGSRQFNARRVGFSTEPEPGTFHFRVHDERGAVIPGNSNAGHSGRFFTHRRAENGTLREFTDDERWALVEYLKTLN
jgi:hypothetical protein